MCSAGTDGTSASTDIPDTRQTCAPVFQLVGLECTSVRGHFKLHVGELECVSRRHEHRPQQSRTVGAAIIECGACWVACVEVAQRL